MERSEQSWRPCWVEGRGRLPALEHPLATSLEVTRLLGQQLREAEVGSAPQGRMSRCERRQRAVRRRRKGAVAGGEYRVKEQVGSLRRESLVIRTWMQRSSLGGATTAHGSGSGFPGPRRGVEVWTWEGDAPPSGGLASLT